MVLDLFECIADMRLDDRIDATLSHVEQFFDSESSERIVRLALGRLGLGRLALGRLGLV